MRSLSGTVTEVNGRPTPKGQDVPDKPGDRIRLAGALMLVALQSSLFGADDDGQTMFRPAPSAGPAADSVPAGLATDSVPAGPAAEGVGPAAEAGA